MEDLGIFKLLEFSKSRTGHGEEMKTDDLRERCDNFARGLYSLLQLGDHVRLPNAFLAVTSAAVDTFVSERLAAGAESSSQHHRACAGDIGEPGCKNERIAESSTQSK